MKLIGARLKAGRTLTVVRADVFGIDDKAAKELIATMQSTMISLHRKE